MIDHHTLPHNYVVFWVTPEMKITHPLFLVKLFKLDHLVEQVNSVEGLVTS